jgi:hypothetical protein
MSSAREIRLQVLLLEYERLRRQYDNLQTEHEALKALPALDRFPHFRRLATHRSQLRAFREKLNGKTLTRGEK